MKGEAAKNKGPTMDDIAEPGKYIESLQAENAKLRADVDRILEREAQIIAEKATMLLQINDLKRMLQIGYGFLQHEHRDPKVFHPGCFKCEVWKTFTPKEEFQKVPQAHVAEKQNNAPAANHESDKR